MTRPSIGYFHECFKLDGGDLRWRERPRRHFGSDLGWVLFNSRYPGDFVAVSERDGEALVRFKVGGKRRRFPVAKIIFALTHGRWPTAARPQPVAGRNKHGLCGVHRRDRRGKVVYRARVRVSGRDYYSKDFKTAEEAHAAYWILRAVRHGYEEAAA